MEYRRMGRSGLQVSALSLGTANFGQGVELTEARELVAMAFDAGVNYIDTAENYGAGRSEEFIGTLLKELKVPRQKYVIATKYFMGLGNGPNEVFTLNRKYLHHAIDGSLRRLGLDHVDIIYCHWPDPATPIEETVFALHTLIERGKALYWATSNWRAETVRAAIDIAERHHLHKPIVDQMEYNLLYRARAENEFARVTSDTGVGIVAYSPLAGGLLSGKYRAGASENSRANQTGMDQYREGLISAQRNEMVARLEEIARELGCSIAQFAIAWCAIHPRIASVALGASKAGQLAATLGSLDFLDKFTPDVLARVNETVGDYNQSWIPPRPNRPTT